MELFLTFIVIFIPIFLVFMCFRTKDGEYVYGWFIFIFIFLHVFHLIIISLLLSKNYYKKSILWINNDYQYIHLLPINPIIGINTTYNKINSEDFINLKYTLEKTNVFYKECLKNFYIKDDNCPITDINLSKVHINPDPSYKEVKINNTLFLYYTNKKINGTLFFNNDLNLNDLSHNIFDLNKFNEEEKTKEKKVTKAIKNLKYYIDYSDFICLSLFFLSIALMIINFWYKDLFQFINIILQIVIFIFYLIRYIKFIDLKKTFTKYKNFILLQYENNDSYEYFPNKYFNIDSFAIALQINILLFIILYSRIFENCFIKDKYLKEDSRNEEHYTICIIICCLVLIIPGNIIYLTNLISNSDKIKYRLNNILYNWELLNPIKSIHVTNNSNHLYLDINHSLILESYAFNYKTIFYDNKYKDSKICGKDSYGNDLYFPKDVECPINDIIITEDENFDTKGIYTRLELNNSFIYYTNKKIDRKIITSLQKNVLNMPTSNFQESEKKEIYSNYYIQSYSNIGIYNNYYFFSCSYMGINQEMLPKQEKITDFKNKLKKYEVLIKAIEGLLISYYIIMPFSICFSVYEYGAKKELLIIFTAIFGIFFIPILIISSICLSINRNYVNNFMNKINETYENNKVNFSWETMIICYSIIIITILTLNNIIIFFDNCFKNFIDQIFECNLCECGKCKACECDCDFGSCECLKCLKNSKCDCNCDCFKCFQKDNNNNNNNHIPNLPSENININNNDIINEISSLKNMISNMVESNNNHYKKKNIDLDETENKISDKNKSSNNLEINIPDKEMKEEIINIKNICNDCLEKINNYSSKINSNNNDIKNLQNNFNNSNNKYNEEIIQIKNDIKEIKSLCQNCSEKIKNYKKNPEKMEKNDNDLKIIIKYENKIYQIIFDNDCSYRDFIKKIYFTLSPYLNGISINSLKFYYWNQLGERIKIMNENDFLNSISLHIFYFEVIIEDQKQTIQQNYINSEDK